MPRLLFNVSIPRTRTQFRVFSSSFNQDKIGLDGVLRPSGTSNSQNTYVIGNPVKGGKTAPFAPPLNPKDLDQLAQFVYESRKKGILCITGAGVSTQSNIPDYRSPNGAYSTGFKPMSHQAFMATPQNRSRYWSRSFAGWYQFSKTKPNSAHDGITRLDRNGWIHHVITQNVDRLHHMSGLRCDRILEMHGTTHEVICMTCQRIYPRQQIQEMLVAMNPKAAKMAEKLLIMNDGENSVRPDGDIEVEKNSLDFQAPICPSCGTDGIMKPHVVFFGDSLGKEQAEKSISLAQNASHVLVVGSSLAVWSAFRLTKIAKENGAKIAIVNVGETRADELADLKVAALAGETMIQLAAHPSLLIPPLRSRSH